MVGLSVAVVVFGAAAGSTPVAAGANQIGSARSQLESLHSQVIASAARIRALTLAYEEADTQAATLAQQVVADQANLARLRGAAAATVSALRSDAIVSYTGGAGVTTGGSYASDDPAVRAEYLAVAAGDLADTVDQYRTEEGQVATAQTALSAQIRAHLAAEQATDQARRNAIAEAGAVQNQLVTVESQLQRLEAAQAAQTAAAEAAARAAAMQGLPVNGGLVAAIRTVVTPSGGGGAGGVWLQLRECESGNNYRANTGNGFFGAYQFSPQTWANLGYPGRPDLEPPAMQDQAAQKLQSQSGWGQWPACSAALGLN